MTTLLEIREYLKDFYSRFSQLITMAAKFIMVLAAMLMIDSRIGYSEVLSGPLPALVVALIGSLVPTGAICLILAIVILAQLYSLSLIPFVIGAILALLMLLLYFRFSPDDGALVILTPIACTIGIPYVMPLAAGLLYSPAAIAAIAAGLVTHFYLVFVSANSTALSNVETAQMVSSIQFLLDGVFKNSTLLVMLVAFAVSVTVVWFIRRLRMSNAWTIASGAGALAQILVLVIGSLRQNTNLSVGYVLLGMVVSLLICAVLIFLFFNLDYTRIENMQYEDDDYYYYVKAVPKVSVNKRERKVRRISGSGRRDDRYRDEEDEDAGVWQDEAYPDDREQAYEDETEQGADADYIRYEDAPEEPDRNAAEDRQGGRGQDWQ